MLAEQNEKKKRDSLGWIERPLLAVLSVLLFPPAATTNHHALQNEGNGDGGQNEKKRQGTCACGQNERTERKEGVNWEPLG